MKKIVKKTVVKKAQGGTNINKTQQTLKKLIKEGDVRVNRGRNNLTTGDVHADNETTAAQRLGSRISHAAEKVYNPSGSKKEKKPDKVLSALSKKNGGKVIKKKS